MVIVIVVRIFGFLFNKIGQPAVIGEIVAGIVLGPSILGAFSPDVFNFIFPAASFINLQFLSQVGLMLFMFVIGMELDINLIRKQAKEAVIISHASIIIPYTLGMTLALYLFKQFAPPTISFFIFCFIYGHRDEHHRIPRIGPHYTGKKSYPYKTWRYGHYLRGSG